MDKYTLDCLRNQLNPVISGFSKPQKDCINTLVRQILIKGTPILRHLVPEDERLVKPQARKFSRHLSNIELESKVDELAFKQTKGQVEEDTSIAYDLCDIAKESAKVMEKLSKIWDGSKRKKSTGYFLHGIGVGDILLKFKPHLANKHTLNQTRRDLILKLAEEFDRQGIWLLDRGNDDKQFFHDLAEEKINFICRIKKNRLAVVKETGERLKIHDLEAGKHEIYLLDEHNHKPKTDHVFVVVIHEHLENKEEMALLTNLPADKYSAEEFVQKYLQRWGIENSFKRVKTKFMLEKIRVLKFDRFVNLVALIRLCSLLATTIYKKVLDQSKCVLMKIYHLVTSFKAFRKRRALTENLDAFISFLGHHLQPFVTRKIPDPPNLSLFSKYTLEKLAPF